MANNPIFIGTTKAGTAQLTNQVLNRIGDAGTSSLLWTAGSSGSFIDTIYAFPTGIVAANVLRLYMTLTGTTTKILIAEKLLAAAASAPANDAMAGYPIAMDLPKVFTPGVLNQTGLILPASAILDVALGTAEATSTFNVIAIGGDY